MVAHHALLNCTQHLRPVYLIQAVSETDKKIPGINLCPKECMCKRNDVDITFKVLYSAYVIRSVIVIVLSVLLVICNITTYRMSGCCHSLFPHKLE